MYNYHTTTTLPLLVMNLCSWVTVRLFVRFSAAFRNFCPSPTECTAEKHLPGNFMKSIYFFLCRCFHRVVTNSFKLFKKNTESPKQRLYESNTNQDQQDCPREGISNTNIKPKRDLLSHILRNMGGQRPILPNQRVLYFIVWFLISILL